MSRSCENIAHADKGLPNSLSQEEASPSLWRLRRNRVANVRRNVAEDPDQRQAEGSSSMLRKMTYLGLTDRFEEKIW